MEVLSSSDPLLELWFPTPIWGFEIAGSEHANAAAIAGVRAAQSADPLGVSQSNCGGWQSPEQFESPSWLDPIGQIFVDRAAEIARKCGYRTPLTLSWWANVNGPHALNRLHLHPGNTLSGVYYLQACPASGRMSFIDIRFLRQMATLADPDCELRNLHFDEAAYAPVPGRGFIFPSWVPHYVEQNNGIEDRISLSFNFR
jgi:uncharacterized protein (TIGR02466 family)